jgi:hypothetical protein
MIWWNAAQNYKKSHGKKTSEYKPITVKLSLQQIKRHNIETYGGVESNINTKRNLMVRFTTRRFISREMAPMSIG